MGVDNLWSLVAPKGRKLKLSALEDKVIAIDASMWMYQFARSLKDPETGEPLRGAHIMGFFRRICKLLLLKIKPIFVFDGPPPLLKLETLRRRNDERLMIDRRVKVLAARIVLNAVQSRDKPNQSQTNDDEAFISSSSSSSSSSEPEEIYDLESDPDDQTHFRRNIPAAFRGFVSERRSLDEIHVSHEPLNPPNTTPKPVVLVNDLNLDAFEAMSGRKAYQELGDLQRVLLREGRSWALSQSLSQSESTNFSNVQTHAFLQRAKIADMISSMLLG